jgi:hypothetical protein
MISTNASYRPERDIGLTVLDDVYAQIVTDDKWSIRDDRSFTWWAKDFPQTITVSEPQESRGFRVCRLTAHIPILDGVTTDQRSYSLLSDRNAFGGTLSALVLDECGALSYVTTATVYQQLGEWIPKHFATVAAMQVAEAQIQAPSLHQDLGGRLSAAVHPQSGPRFVADDLSLIVERLIAPTGRLTSAWNGSDMADVADMLRHFGYEATAEETRLLAHFPFRESMTGLRLDTEHKHSRVGHGLHVALFTPLPPAKGKAAELAMLLNRLEIAPENFNSFAGAWCLYHDMIVFSAFYANALYKKGLARKIAMTCVERTNWLNAGPSND